MCQIGFEKIHTLQLHYIQLYVITTTTTITITITTTYTTIASKCKNFDLRKIMFPMHGLLTGYLFLNCFAHQNI